MRSGFKYFVIVSLFISMFPFNGYASIEKIQTVSSEKEIVCTYVKTNSDSNKLINHIQIFLLSNVAVKNGDTYVSKFRFLSYIFSDYNNQIKLRNYIYSSTQHTPVNIFLPPLGYYIYGLENIRI